MELNTKIKILFILVIATNNICAENLTSASTVKPKNSSSKVSSNASLAKSSSKVGNTTPDYYFISTTKEPFEICELNSTCNATDFLNATDGELLSTNFSEKISIIRNYPINQQFCTCDLQVSFCYVLYFMCIVSKDYFFHFCEDLNQF